MMRRSWNTEWGSGGGGEGGEGGHAPGTASDASLRLRLRRDGNLILSAKHASGREEVVYESGTAGAESFYSLTLAPDGTLDLRDTFGGDDGSPLLIFSSSHDQSRVSAQPQPAVGGGVVGKLRKQTGVSLNALKGKLANLMENIKNQLFGEADAGEDDGGGWQRDVGAV